MHQKKCVIQNATRYSCRKVARFRLCSPLPVILKHKMTPYVLLHVKLSRNIFLLLVHRIAAALSLRIHDFDVVLDKV